jgi:hypothetical protein
MRKKIVYSGIALVLIAVLILFISGKYLLPQFPLGEQLMNVSANGFSYATLNVTPPSTIVFIGRSTAPLNVYVMDSAGFAAWKSQVTISHDGLSYAYNLSKLGEVLAIFTNTTVVSLPVLSNATSTPYISNASAQSGYAAGQYYLVFDNTNGSASKSTTVQEQLVLPVYLLNGSVGTETANQFKSMLTNTAVAGLAFLILLIVGILVAVFGLIKKPKTAQPAASPQGGVGQVQPPSTPQTAKEKESEKQIDAIYRAAKKSSSKKKPKDKKTDTS